MTKNQDFYHLNDPLPCDIAQRKGMGDIQGALRLIDAALASGGQPELAPRLRLERMRLTGPRLLPPCKRSGLAVRKPSSTLWWMAGA